MQLKPSILMALASLRRYQVLCAVLVGALALDSWGRISSLSYPEAELSLTPILFWGMLHFAFTPLIVMTDSPALPQAFWHTRPANSNLVAVSKLLILLFFGTLLPAFAEVVVMKQAGFPSSDLPWIFLEALLDFLNPLLFFAVIAACSSSIYRYLSGVCCLCALGGAVRGLHSLNLSTFSMMMKSEPMNFTVGNIYLASVTIILLFFCYAKKNSPLRFLLLFLMVLPYPILRYDFLSVKDLLKEGQAEKVSLDTSKVQATLELRGLVSSLDIYGLNLPARRQACLVRFQQNDKKGTWRKVDCSRQMCLKRDELSKLLKEEFNVPDSRILRDNCNRPNALSFKEPDNFEEQGLNGTAQFQLMTQKLLFSLPGKGGSVENYRQIVQLRPANFDFNPELKLQLRDFNTVLPLEGSPPSELPTFFVLYNETLNEALALYLKSSACFSPKVKEESYLPALLGITRPRMRNVFYSIPLYQDDSCSSLSKEWINGAQVFAFSLRNDKVIESSLSIPRKSIQLEH